jgi:serine phosphatase RsbU (regulator of sigma subunit)
LQPHQTFYLSSDGYRDQFGGPNQQKLTKSGFKKVLEGMQHLPVQEQEHHLEAFLSNWMRKQRQLDDILVVGFKA